MSFEPDKFFIGVIDLFSILLPGGLLVLLGQDTAARLLGHDPLKLDNAISWMLFAVFAYLLGHLVFLAGAWLDEPYDWFRTCAYWGQIKRLAEGKDLSGALCRKRAKAEFGADAALIEAARIRARAIAQISEGNPINTYQWCKSRLWMSHPESLAEVQRFEADSKFFRSFAIILLVLFVMYVATCDWRDALVCVVLLPATLWRYVNERFKATERAYFHAITLESLERKGEQSSSAHAKSSKLSHAGGIVFRDGAEGRRYLLVEAEDNRSKWVLPKGHIEAGEAAAQAAVREVEEETGSWGSVVGWAGDRSFEAGGETVTMRVFKMRFAGQNRENLPVGERQSKWFSAAEIVKIELPEESGELLRKVIDDDRKPGTPRAV